MAERLELSHLLHQDRVAQMQIWVSRIKAGLHSQWSAVLQPLEQVVRRLDAHGAVQESFELCFRVDAVSRGG